jgi:hypothetical protein
MSDFQCPKCDRDHDINELELWELYAEDGAETEIQCKQCDEPLIVRSEITGWNFEAEINE